MSGNVGKYADYILSSVILTKYANLPLVLTKIACDTAGARIKVM